METRSGDDRRRTRVRRAGRRGFGDEAEREPGGVRPDPRRPEAGAGRAGLRGPARHPPRARAGGDALRFSARSHLPGALSAGGRARAARGRRLPRSGPGGERDGARLGVGQDGPVARDRAQHGLAADQLRAGRGADPEEGGLQRRNLPRRRAWQERLQALPPRLRSGLGLPRAGGRGGRPPFQPRGAGPEPDAAQADAAGAAPGRSALREEFALLRHHPPLDRRGRAVGRRDCLAARSSGGAPPQSDPRAARHEAKPRRHRPLSGRHQPGRDPRRDLHQ